MRERVDWREKWLEIERASPSRGGRGPEPGLWEPEDTPCPATKGVLAPRNPGEAPLSPPFSVEFGRISSGAAAVRVSLSTTS